MQVRTYSAWHGKDIHPGHMLQIPQRKRVQYSSRKISRPLTISKVYNLLLFSFCPALGCALAFAVLPIPAPDAPVFHRGLPFGSSHRIRSPSRSPRTEPPGWLGSAEDPLDGMPSRGEPWSFLDNTKWDTGNPTQDIRTFRSFSSSLLFFWKTWGGRFTDCVRN